MFLIEADGPLSLRHTGCGRIVYSTLFPVTSIDVGAVTREIDDHFKQGCTPVAAEMRAGSAIGTATVLWIKAVPGRWKVTGTDLLVSDEDVQGALDDGTADVLRDGPLP